jgi:hypothetical protein
MMIQFSKICGAILVAAVAAGVVTPEPADARRKAKAVAVKTAQAFRAADVDQSRQLDTSEWTTAGYDSGNFAAIDRNGNGTLGYWETLAAVFTSLKAKAAGR